MVYPLLSPSSYAGLDAKDALLPFVNSYIEKFNACRFDEMGEFYDVNAVMIEKDKSCLFGRKDISNSLKDMATECGQTEMKASSWARRLTPKGISDLEQPL